MHDSLECDIKVLRNNLTSILCTAYTNKKNQTTLTKGTKLPKGEYDFRQYKNSRNLLEIKVCVQNLLKVAA